MNTSTFKYTLDPGSKKFHCPNCMKKSYVQFIEIETGQYLNYKFGRCDREQKCGYFNPPEGNHSVNQMVNYSVDIPKPKASFIPIEFVNEYFAPEREHENHFIQFLNSVFKKKDADKIITDYLISTCTYWGKGATIFWQIDENENVRSGQVILYDGNSGKRIKKPFHHVTWVHTILKKNGAISDFNLEQTLFGMHLSSWQPEKGMIAIVEAPKTACIMSAIFPEYVWMATCGLSNIQPDKFKPIKSKKIVLYPDLGAFNKWSEKANKLKKFGYNLAVSDMLEKKYSNAKPGMDIADFYMPKKSNLC